MTSDSILATASPPERYRKLKQGDAALSFYRPAL